MKLFKLKATEQDFPVVMFILLYIMVLTFESVDEILSVIIQREATKQYDSVERRSLLHPNTAQGSVFPLQSYSKKTLRKKCPEKRSKIQTKCAHARSCPPGHPIILFKSN